MTETDARYAIVVDGIVSAYRDTGESALEAANVLKALSPHAKVIIRDLHTGAKIDPRKENAPAQGRGQ